MATDTCQQRGITLDNYTDTIHVANVVTSYNILTINITQSYEVAREDAHMPHILHITSSDPFSFINVSLIMTLETHAYIQKW